jgi:RND family efflux transporter MFP subunit
MSTDSPRPARYVPYGVAVGMMALFLAAAFYMMNRANARAQSAPQDENSTGIAVDVRTVDATAIPVNLTARGFFRGFDEVTVHAEVSGRVLERAEEGRVVDAGDTLCRIDDTFYRIAVDRAAANLTAAEGQRDQAAIGVDAAEASLAEAQAARENAQIEFDRCQALHAGGNAPRIELDRRRTQLDRARAVQRQAEAELAGARQKVTSAEAAADAARTTLTEAKEQLARCCVSSPIAGRVDRTTVDVGEYAVTGQPLAEVIRLDKMRLQIELTGAEVALLSGGVAAEVSVDAVPDHVYPARLDHVAPKADEQTRKFRVEFHVNNDDGRLLSGMFGQARLTCQQWTDVIRVPLDAIVTRFGVQFCYVVEDESGVAFARLRKVRTRAIPGEPQAIEILDGLAPGERYVVEPDRRLADGIRVRIKTPASGDDSASPPETDVSSQGRTQTRAMSAPQAPRPA